MTGLALALHLTSQAILVMDCAQTLQIQRHGNQHETNPILGRHPSDAKVIAYFVAWTAANELVYQHGPRWLSLGTSITITAVEVPVIGKNFKLGLTLGF